MSYVDISFNSANYTSSVGADFSSLMSGVMSSSASTFAGLDGIAATMATNYTQGNAAASASSGHTIMGMSVDDFCAYLENNGSAMNEYFQTSEDGAAGRLKQNLSELGEDATTGDFTKAWLKAQNPDMSDAEIDKIIKDYEPFTKEMEERYAELDKEYGEKDGSGEENIEEYYSMMIDKLYPDLSPEEKSAMIKQYSSQYEELTSQYEAAANEMGLSEDSTLGDYYAAMVRKNYPDLTDAEVAKVAAAYEKASQPMVDYYKELEELFPNAGFNPGAEGLLKDCEAMVGLKEGNPADAAKINQITKKSGIDCRTTPWCAAFAMNMLKDHGVLDTKGCSNVNYCPTIRNWAKGEDIWRNSQSTGGKYVPKAGDAILFDWDQDGTADHIGIVRGVKDGRVYTVEGNSSNSVANREYALGSNSVMGYIDCAAQKKSKD